MKGSQREEREENRGKENMGEDETRISPVTPGLVDNIYCD